MLGAVRQQAITWANVYPVLCCYTMSLGINELSDCAEYDSEVKLTHTP